MSLVNQVLRDLESKKNANSPLKLEAIEDQSWLAKHRVYFFIGFLMLVIIGLLTRESTESNNLSTTASLQTENIQTENLSASLAKTDASTLIENDSKNQALTNSNTDTDNLLDKKEVNLVSPIKTESDDNKIADVQKLTDKNAVNNKVAKIDQTKRLSLARPKMDIVDSPARKENQLQKKKLVQNANNSAKPIKKKESARQVLTKAEEKPVKTESKSSLLNEQLNRIISDAAFVGEEKTIERLDTLVKQHPKFDDARLQLIKFAWQVKDPRLEGFLKTAIAISPSQSGFHSAAARYYLEKKDYQKALLMINQFSGGKLPSNLLQLRALVLQRAGDHSSAIRDYVELLSVSQQTSSIYLAIGISFESLGEAQKAKTSYQRALDSKQLTDKQRLFVQNKINLLRG